MSVFITKHAVARYRERVRPVSMKQAQSELEHVLQFAEVSNEAPGWAGERLRQDVDYYLVLGDVALVVINNHAVTVLTKGSLPPVVRRARKHERRRRQARRKRVAGT